MPGQESVGNVPRLRLKSKRTEEEPRGEDWLLVDGESFVLLHSLDAAKCLTCQVLIISNNNVALSS